MYNINNIFVNPASSDGDSGTSGSSLPNVTNEDNGKTLKVDNGKWIVAKQSYTDLVDTPTLTVNFSSSFNFVRKNFSLLFHS